eukprot:475587-Prymnesium_polylepis.1
MKRRCNGYARRNSYDYDTITACEGRLAGKYNAVSPLAGKWTCETIKYTPGEAPGGEGVVEGEGVIIVPRLRACSRVRFHLRRAVA